MTTQQDLVHRLNQLTLRYNLTWFDIKYDADLAIEHINNFMGTKYPPISLYMTHSDATYTFRASKHNVPIFPDRYMHSVVIPYIAIQILTRDEEFTQVYQKYQQDLDDGLYQMFHNEFNRVPYEFRQNPDQGVFFSPESADEARRIKNFNHHNRRKDLPSPKFRVSYYPNNDEALLTVKFVEDMHGYKYGDTVKVKGFSSYLYSTDGLIRYSLQGWTYDKGNTSTELHTNDEFEIINDTNLFALWDRYVTIEVNSGIVTIKNKAEDKLRRLRIPERVYGRRAEIIPADFAKNADLLEVLELPPSLKLIRSDAFNEFNGTTILFNETEQLESVTIEKNAFINMPNLTSIVIPTNVTKIKAGAFKRTNDNVLTIYVRFLKENVPAGWEEGWHDIDPDYIKVEYGWNG